MYVRYDNYKMNFQKSINLHLFLQCCNNLKQLTSYLYCLWFSHNQGVMKFETHLFWRTKYVPKGFHFKTLWADFFYALCITKWMTQYELITCMHWIGKHRIEVRQDDWLIIVISRQHGNVLSVQLLPSNGSHFLAALRYALTNAWFTAF